MQLPRFALLLALSMPLGALAAQGPARTGRVRGIVVDSLLGAVLPDATVRIAQLDRWTRSDSVGRFVFDSVPPGEWAVTFRYPALDSLGLVDQGTMVRVFGGATATATLATRSFGVFREHFCSGTPDSLSSTLAFGNVRALDGSRVRVDVSVIWIATGVTDPAGGKGSVRTYDTDTEKAWVACGVPWGSWIHASVRDSSRTASAILSMGARGIATHDLVLSAGVTRAAGVVRDADGQPVRGARVGVVGSPLAGETEATGAFALDSVPRGTFTLDVRAAGHRPWLGVIDGDTGPIEVSLQPLVAVVDEDPKGSDYLRLLERLDNHGMQLTAGAALVSDSTTLEQRIPAGTCRWWLDGRPVDRDFFLAQPRWSWRALEIYAKGTDAPPEYRSASCAVALLWTAAADW